MTRSRWHGHFIFQGGVFGPRDPCTKTGLPVINVLKLKHPDQRIPDLEDPNSLAFTEYQEYPDPGPIDCTAEDVERIATKLTGAAGCSSMDAALLQACLIRYGKASAILVRRWWSGRSGWRIPAPRGLPTALCSNVGWLPWISSQE